MQSHLSTLESELWIFCTVCQLIFQRWSEAGYYRLTVFDIMLHLFTMLHAETSFLIVSSKMPDGSRDTSRPENSSVNSSLSGIPLLKYQRVCWVYYSYKSYSNRHFGALSKSTSRIHQLTRWFFVRPESCDRNASNASWERKMRQPFGLWV